MDNLPQFNIVDIAALVVILLGVVRGLAHGLSGELARGVSAVVAVYGGWRLYRPLGVYLADHTRLSEPAAYPAAFVLMLVGGYVAMRIVRLVVDALVDFSFKGRLEKAGGALLGVARALIVFGAFVAVMGIVPNSAVHRLFAEQSVFGRLVCRQAVPLYDRLAEKHPGLKAEERGERPGEDVEPKVDEEDVPPAEMDEEAY